MLTLITQAETLPISVEYLANYLKYTDLTEEDEEYLEGLIDSALGYINKQTVGGLDVKNDTWELRLPCFPSSDREPIELTKPPVKQLLKIEYYDENDDLQTLYDATGEEVTGEARLIKRSYLPSKVYCEHPSTYKRDDAVIITFVTGWEDGEFPADLMQLALMLCAEFDANRGDTVNDQVYKTAERILLAYGWC